MKCKECEHWQGNKYSTWADCYCVVAHLQPSLSDCYLTNEYGTIERFFEVPFDPHDIKYWIHNSFWHRLYLDAAVTCIGVRMKEEVRDDIVYDHKKGERTGRLKLRYYQTHKDYECEKEY